MSQIYEGLEGVEVVFDDILVHGATREENDCRLKVALQKSCEAGDWSVAQRQQMRVCTPGSHVFGLCNQGRRSKT